MLVALMIATIALGSCSSGHLSENGLAKAPLVEDGYFPGADGVRLFYRKVGTGKDVVVYLHGGPSNMADGGYSLDALAVGRTLFSFDQRSGGRSQLLDDPTRMTADYYVRDLEALRQHFGLERMALVGQSWGASLAAMYTAKHPDAVTRLVLLSPALPASRFWPERLAKTTAAVGEAGMRRLAELDYEMRIAPDNRVAALCKESNEILFHAYLNDVSALKRMPVGYCDFSPAALRHELDAPALLSKGDFDLLPMLTTLKQPTLVVEGADTKMPIEATRAWATALPNSHLLLVPNASHITWLEGDVPKLISQLNAFLASSVPTGAETITH